MFVFDELASGAAPADAARIALDLAVDPARLAGLTLATFYTLAFFVEPPLLRAGERVAPRWAAGAALGALAAILACASLVWSTWAFLVFIAMYGPASGLATSTAEGVLCEAAPRARERTLARVHLAGALGDLAVPALLAVVTWRDYFRLAAVFAAALALVVGSARSLRRPPGDPRAADGDEANGPDALPGEHAAARAPTPRLRDALRNRPLVGWALAESLTGLMDEVAVAFVGVHLYARFELGASLVASGIAAWTFGGLVGLALLDRLLVRASAMSLLSGAAALALAMFALVLSTDDVRVVCGALFVLGAAVAAFHPIVAARTYASLPGHPGVVNAVRAMFTPLDLMAPLVLGFVAETVGSAAALCALAIVPAVMLGVGLRVGAAHVGRPSGTSSP